MAISKALVLKGIAVLAALGGATGAGAYYLSRGDISSLFGTKRGKRDVSSSIVSTEDVSNDVTVEEDQNTEQDQVSEPTTDGVAVEISNDSSATETTTPKESEPTEDEQVNSSSQLESTPTEDDLGLPVSCQADQVKSGIQKDCDLTKEQLQKVKFASGSSITVTGLDEGKKVNLTIEHSNDTTAYPKGKKYTFKSTDSQVRIAGIKGGDVELNKDKGVEFKEVDGKLEKIPTEDNLGIPLVCEADKVTSSTTSKTCQLTAEQIKKIKFSSSGSIDVTGLVGDNKITLAIAHENDKTIYPKGKKYTFTNNTSAQVTIKSGKREIMRLIANNGAAEFREASAGGSLERTPTEDASGIPYSCKAHEVTFNQQQQKTCTLTAEQLKKIKFKDLGGVTGSSIIGLNNGSTITLKVDYTTESKYPGNRKYAFDNTNRKTNIVITGRVGSDEKELKIEKGKETYFKEVNGILEKVESRTKLEVQKRKKMKEVNDTLTNLGLGEFKLKLQNFNDNNDGTKYQKKEFELDEEGLKKVQFKELNGVPETIESPRKVKVELYYEDDSSKFPNNMKFVFTNANEDNIDVALKKEDKSIKIFSVKSGNTSNDIFKVTEGKLDREPNK